MRALCSCIEAISGSLFTWVGVQSKIRSLFAFLAVVQVVELLRQYGSAAGPGTTVADVRQADQVGNLLNRSCFEPQGIPARLSEMFTEHLGALFAGANPLLWLMLGVTLLLGLGRICWSCFSERTWPWRPDLQSGTYLFLVGLMAPLAHVAVRCGQLGHLRYSLLAQLAPIGVVAVLMSVERSRLVNGGVLSVVVVWASIGLAQHVTYLNDYLTRAPDPTRVLAEYLVDNKIRYARSNYWIAYEVTFLTGEEVIVASTNHVRIRQYQTIADAHRDEAVTLTRRRCPGGIETKVNRHSFYTWLKPVPGTRYYVCPPP